MGGGDEGEDAAWGAGVLGVLGRQQTEGGAVRRGFSEDALQGRRA